jgi:hypothetical protein
MKTKHKETILTRKGFNGMPLHVMEQPPRFFALAYRVSDACIYCLQIAHKSSSGRRQSSENKETVTPEDINTNYSNQDED